MLQIEKFVILNDLTVEAQRKETLECLLENVSGKQIDSREMLIDVGVCIVHQINTSMDVCKITYAQAIARIQLGLQIITACITHISQLQ